MEDFSLGPLIAISLSKDRASSEVGYRVLWYAPLSFGLSFLLVWFGLVWFGLVWFGLVWFGWFGPLLPACSHLFGCVNIAI